MANDRDPFEEYDDSRDNDCWNCGGEGYIADCFDGFCVNAEDGCDLCMRHCDICNRPKDRKATISISPETHQGDSTK